MKRTLIFAAFAVTCVAVAAAAEVSPRRNADARTVSGDTLKHLALDPRLIAETRDVRLAMGRVDKEARNPLFLADKPWENALNNLYPNVVFDPERRCFRMWYKCVLADKDAIAKMMPPATVHGVGWFLLYAESPDGLTWSKPDLGLIGFDGLRQTNIVARDTPNASVCIDPRETASSRRFKMLYDVGPGQMRVRFSADGLRWSEPQTPAGFTPYSGDTHNNAFWDERLGKYVAITRFYLGERLVARSESRDFLNWENTRLALRSTLDEGRARQLYCMPTFPYGSGYLGFLMVYNVGKDRTVDCELVWSADTLVWRRVLPGTPLIPRGPAESCDSGCIYAQAGPPVLKDRKLLIYYGGSTAVHRGWKRHCLPCLAYLRPDGFAGYEPTTVNVTGRLVTAPLRCVGQPLRLSADAASGSVQVSLLDEEGRELGSSQPITTDVTDTEVSWNGALPFATWRDRTIRLRIELKHATLYAVSGVELVNTALPAPPRPTGSAVPASQPTELVRYDATFDESDEGWRGISRVERRAADDGKGGSLYVAREDGNAFAFATPQSSAGRFSGDLRKTFGGRGITISFRVRSPHPATGTQIELFARDIAQWSYGKLPAPGKDWTNIRVTLNYDWTDDEARAAGWQPAIHAFSWPETVRNVGKVVVGASFSNKPSAFALDDFAVQTVVE